MRKFIALFIMLFVVLAYAATDKVTSTYNLLLREPSASGTERISIISPALSSNWQMTLPADDGTSGHVLSTNGSGVTSWVNSLSSFTLVSPVISNGTASTVPYLDASKILVSSAVTPTELGYVSGVTSAIQTQINAKAPSASPTFSGTITTPLTASRAMVTGASSELAVSATTATELGYVSGVTSAVQTQLDAKVLKSTLTAKGSLLTATAASTPAELAVGTDGYSLVADSGSATGLNWSAPGAAAAGGAGTQVQYNSSGVLGGDAGMTYDSTGDKLTVVNALISGLTASRAVVTDASKNLTSSAATSTEVGYLSGVTSTIQGQLDSKTSSYEISNLTLSTSVSGNALTIAIKTKAGSDASAGDPIKVGMRDATLTSGLYNQRSITGALSLVVSSGSTLGQRSAAAARLFVYLIDNAGTLELAVSQSQYSENSLFTTTAEGGAGAADSGITLYSTTARTSVPGRLIATIDNTQATAGTWASAGSKINVGSYAQLTSEPVNARYTLTSSTGNSSFADVTDEIIDFDTQDFDNTNSSITTGGSWKFTAPISGIYKINSMITWNSTSNLTTTLIKLYVNGAENRRIGFAKTDDTVYGPTEVKLLAGEYINVILNQDDSGGAARAIYTGANSGRFSWIEIARVGY